MRIALLTYSTKARGGVVHTLAVAEALAGRGHDVEVLAIGPPGARFFREPRVAHLVFPYTGPGRPLETKILAMIKAYARHLEAELERFDVVHAQDCLSASAVVAARGRVPAPIVFRTVHHVDDFTSPALVECQHRSIVEPDQLLVVSRFWQDELRSGFGVEAKIVPNGVDLARFRPPAPAERARARARLELDGRPVVLTVGGIEPRKGSLLLAEALALMPQRPLLLIAGGETLFDYRAYRDRFFDRVRELGLETDVQVLGPVPDEELPMLYHAADAFAFPSEKEGFGLAVLEAQASELPVVVSDIPVFREFLIDERSALFAGASPAALAAGLSRVLSDEPLRDRLRVGGRAVAGRFGWEASAEAHERVYAAARR